VGFFESLSVVQRRPISLLVESVVIKSERGHFFFYPSCFFLSECWLYLHNNVGFFLASFLH
jgi:hypothetical protein